MIQFLLRLDPFQMKNMTIKENISHLKNSILLQSIIQRNISLSKLTFYTIFSKFFVLRCANEYKRLLLVTVKSIINLDNVLKEIAFDYGVVMRLVPCILNSSDKPYVRKCRFLDPRRNL